MEDVIVVDQNEYVFELGDGERSDESVRAGGEVAESGSVMKESGVVNGMIGKTERLQCAEGEGVELQGHGRGRADGEAVESDSIMKESGVLDGITGAAGGPQCDGGESVELPGRGPCSVIKKVNYNKIVSQNKGRIL